MSEKENYFSDDLEKYVKNTQRVLVDIVQHYFKGVKDTVSTIVFIQGAYRYKHLHKEAFSTFCGDVFKNDGIVESAEVLGNIFENPELLKNLEILKL